MEELVDRVLDAWRLNDEREGLGFQISADPHTARMLAETAVEAVQCGAIHPDRPTIRCTELPHDRYERGPLYHRDARHKLEWYKNPDGLTTVHDDLGPLTLVKHFAPTPTAKPATDGCTYSRPVEPDGEITPDPVEAYRNVLTNTADVMIQAAAAAQQVADKYHSRTKTLNVANYRSLRDTAAELSTAANAILSIDAEDTAKNTEDTRDGTQDAS